MRDDHQLSADTRAIIEALRETKGDMERQIAAMLSEQKRIRQDIDSIKDGFPNGDPTSHREYHESVIEWRQLRNQIVRESIINASKVGLLGSLCWFAYAIFSALKMELTK